MLGSLQGVEDSYELINGISRAANFPDAAQFSMDPDFPDDTLLIDNLLSDEFLIVASSRLVRLVREVVPSHLECLPVSIINHKGKIASRDYRIINPIEPIDCLDLPRCLPKWGTINPESIKSVARLVLDEAKIPESRWMFRPKAFRRVTLVRRELAERIEAEKFTGVRWVELQDYPEH
jgi:hypothetical protein